MKKSLLAVVVALSLWNSAVLANLPTNELTGRDSPPIHEISFQPLSSASPLAKNEPFAISSEGAFMVAPECFTIIDPTWGFAEEICW